MYVPSIPEQFVNLRSISDTVDDYLSRESYIEAFGPDDYDIPTLLNVCYELIYGDICDYGVTLSIEWRDDGFTRSYLYLILKFIADLPGLIRPVKDSVETYLNSSSADDNEFVDLYEIIHPTDVELSELPYILDYVCTDNTFIEYVKSVVEHLNDETKPVKIASVDRAKAYIAKTGKLRDLIRKYTKIITDNLAIDYDRELLAKYIRDYDIDKISPNNINIFSVIDLTDEVPLAFRELKEKYLHEHHARSIHHIDYFTDPAKVPSPLVTNEALIIMTAHHVEIGTTKEEFADAVEDMISQGRSVLSAGKIELIRKMKDIILANMGEDK